MQRKVKKREKKKLKKLLQQKLFIFGHPAKKEPRGTLIKFVERTRGNAVVVVLILRLHYAGYIICGFLRQRKKQKNTDIG